MKEKIKKLSVSLNEELRQCKAALYEKTVSAIINILQAAATRECPVAIMFRYVDDDKEQSIYRIKKVSLNEKNELIVLYDSNTGDSYASDVRFEYNEDFEGEDTFNFSDKASDIFSIKMALEIYSSLVNYDLPRFLKKREKKHKKILAEFNKTWNDINVDELDDEQLRKYKNACFELYEKTGFLSLLDSPYVEESDNLNGKPFKVIKRATEDEADLEVMPLWLIMYEDGQTAYCYPEEITILEKETKTEQ